MLEARRVSTAALLLLPGALVLYFAFNSGGFYPGPQAYVALLLCLLLAVHGLLAKRPFAGVGPWLGVALTSLAIYCAWVLMSGTWSHAPGVARVELDMPLVYLSGMLLMGSIGRTRSRLRWVLRGLAAATLIVCTCGLITRLLPHVWPIALDIAKNRLSFPVTYWNALGLVAAVGLVLCLHLSSDLGEPRSSRIAAAAAVPILAATLYFTFSRGAIACCLIGVLVYLVVGRPRGLLSSFLAIGPATAVAVREAYGANLLATLNPTAAGAVVQGRHVAVVVLGCASGAALLRAVLAFALDDGLRRLALPPRWRRRGAWTGWVSLGVAALVAVVVLSGTISNEFHRFVHPSGATNTQDLRARLTDPSNNGRLEYWRVAWRDFESRPVTGGGAGTYQDAWARYRRVSYPVRDAHSLYLETLGELGIVGFVLLMIPIVAVLAGAARRARGPARSLYGAVFAVLLVWAIHAAVDWDWEMPVVTVSFFSLGGFVLARRALPDGAPRSSPWTTRLLARAAIASGFALLAVLPAFTWLSQEKLDAAAYAFSQGDCGPTRQAALSSISFLGNRAEPYEFLAYCDVQLGKPRAALVAVAKAISLDPGNWNYRYDLGMARGAAGLDPRAAVRQALAMNPLEPLVQQEWTYFKSGNPATWKREGNAIANSFNTL